MPKTSVLMTILVALAWPVMAADVVLPTWDVREFAEARTIELRTVGDEEGEYWSPVWVVVVDGTVFVRLGRRAADRIKFNATFPDVGVRVGGKQFERVHAEPAARDAERVAAAMAEKYWTDIFVRWLSHPLTLRLVPLAGTPVSGGAE